MRCLHICEHPSHVPRRACGQETDLRCSHCDAPRCADHSLKIEGAVLCLAAARDASREIIAPTPLSMGMTPSSRKLAAVAQVSGARMMHLDGTGLPLPSGRVER